jgi:hypothetical protein
MDCQSTNASAFNTPTFRSKSLISLRRRHWSANTATSSVANSAKRTKSTKTLHRFNENLVYTRSIKKNLFNQTYTYGKQQHRKTDVDDDDDDDGFERKENLVATTGAQLTCIRNKATSSVLNQTNVRTPLKTRYKRRLGLLKTRLLTTKNKIIEKNRKMFGKNRNDNAENENDHEKYKFEANAANQSFGDNLRTRFTSTLKRQNFSTLKVDERNAKKTKYN